MEGGAASWHGAESGRTAQQPHPQHGRRDTRRTGNSALISAMQSAHIASAMYDSAVPSLILLCAAMSASACPARCRESTSAFDGGRRWVSGRRGIRCCCCCCAAEAAAAAEQRPLGGGAGGRGGGGGRTTGRRDSACGDAQRRTHRQKCARECARGSGGSAAGSLENTVTPPARWRDTALHNTPLTAVAQQHSQEAQRASYTLRLANASAAA